MEFKDHFKKASSGQLDPFYLYTGEETYMIDHTIEYIESKYLNPLYKDMNLTVITDTVEIDSLLSTVNTLPFFDNNRLILIYNSHLFKQVKESDESKLLNLFQNFPENVHLIFIEKEVDKRKKLYKAFNKKEAVVTFKKLSSSEFHKWVNKKFKEYKCEISGHALTYFIEMVNYLSQEANQTLYHVENQIKTLSHINQEITTEIIDRYMDVPIEKNIFKMMDAVSEGKISEALFILNQLIEDGEPPIKIFFLLNGQFRNIYKCKELMKAGHTANSIASKLGIHPFVAKKSSHFASKFSTQTLSQIMTVLESIDEGMKSSGLSHQLLMEKGFFEIQLIMKESA